MLVHTYAYAYNYQYQLNIPLLPHLYSCSYYLLRLYSTFLLSILEYGYNDLPILAIQKKRGEHYLFMPS